MRFRGPKAIEAHIRHVETYDLDFLKVMCDGRYPFPHGADGIIQDAADLDRLVPMRGDEDMFGRHLEVLQALSRRFSGELRMTTTIFNSWSTLRRLMAPDSDVHGPPSRERMADRRDAKMSKFLAEAPEVLAKALDAITETLADFARNCLAAGADGIYLAVRDDWVDTRRERRRRLRPPGARRRSEDFDRRGGRDVKHPPRLRHAAGFRPLRRLSRACLELGRSHRRAERSRKWPRGSRPAICCGIETWEHSSRVRRRTSSTRWRTRSRRPADGR